MESIILLILGALYVFILRLNKTSLFSPGLLYVFGQVFTLSIAYLKYNPLMSDFTTMTWLVWGGSMLSFLLGTTVVNVKNSAAIEGKMSNESSLIYWCFALVFIYCYGLSLGLAKAGGWPILSESPEKARFIFQQPRLWGGLCQHACWGLMAIGSIQFFRKQKIERLAWLLVFLFGFSYGFLTGFRLVLMFGVFTFLFAYDRFYRPVSMIRFSVYLGAFTLILFGLLLVRTGELANAMANSKVLGIIGQWMYDYLANNFWNLDYSVQKSLSLDPHPIQWGGGFFNMPFGVLQMIGPIETAYGWDTWKNESSIKVTYLNTISYQWFLIKDFSWFGPMIFPFGWGFVSQWAYEMVRKRKSILHALLYAPLGFSIFFSFFLFMFLTPMYWVYWILLVALAIGQRQICRPG